MSFHPSRAQELLGLAETLTERLRGAYVLTLTATPQRTGRPVLAVDIRMDADDYNRDAERFAEFAGRHLDPQLDEQVHTYSGVVRVDLADGTISLRRVGSGVAQSWQAGERLRVVGGAA